jgi:hypothetical protein
VLRFNDLAPGTVLTNQYHNQGIDFIPRSGSSPVVVRVAPGLAQSGDQVTDISFHGANPGNPGVQGVFTIPRQHVRVFAGQFGNQFGSDTIDVTLSAYDANNRLVAQSAPATLTAGAGFHRLLAVDSPNPNIAWFLISGQGVGKQVAIADLAFDDPHSPAQPDFYLDVPSFAPVLREGNSVTVPIPIGRLDGSTGAVQFAASNLPSGVSAQFTPNPADGRTQLTLTAASVSEPTKAVVTVTATPLKATAAPWAHFVQVAVPIQKNFQVFVNPNDMWVDHCAKSPSLIVTVIRDPAFNGTVDLDVLGLPAGMEAKLAPPSVTFTPGGDNAQTSLLTITASAGTKAPPLFSIFVRAKSSAVVGISTAKVTVHYTEGKVSSMAPTTAKTPQDLKPGTQVVLKGGGFCVEQDRSKTGLKVRFGNINAEVKPDWVTADGTQLAATLPRLATTGKVTVIWPDGFTADAPGTLTVQSYRNTNGFAFKNPDNNAVKWEDIENLFGYDQTHVHAWVPKISFPPCIPNPLDPLSCSTEIVTPVIKPGALLFWGVAAAALNHNGVCFGMGLAAQRLLHGDKPFGAFPLQPGLATPTVWNLAGPDGPSDPLDRYTQSQHLNQWSAEAFKYYFKSSNLNAFVTSNDIYGQIVGALSAPASARPLISLVKSIGHGHVLTAYDIENVQTIGGKKDFYIDVHDPNRPFLASEDSDADSHKKREEESRIHVTSDDKWSFKLDDTETWEGTFGQLVVYPYGTIPKNPTMPISAEGLTKLILGSAAQTTQVADAEGHTLLRPDGTLNDNPATRLPQGVLYAPFDGTQSASDMFLLGGTTTYTHTVRGTGPGTYTDTLFGPNFAALIRADAGLGISDQLTMNPQSANFQFRTGGSRKALMAELIGRTPDGSEHTASVHTTSLGGGADSFAFDASGQTLTYTHSGAAVDYQVTLSGFDVDGTPVSFISPTLHLGPGDRATFTPADWHHLDTVSLTVIHPDHTQNQSTVRGVGGPLQLQGSPVSATEGRAWSGVVATFRDQGGPRTTDSYTALLNWGDGSAPTLGTLRQAGAAFEVLGTHTYAHKGSYQVHVTLRDDEGNTASLVSPARIGAPAIHFRLDGPSRSPAGATFGITVTALDQANDIAVGYTGTVHFSSNDAQAIAPVDYTFTAAEGGMRTFTVTLRTAGNRTVSVIDTANGSLTGSTTISVSTAAAWRFEVSGLLTPITAGAADTFTVTSRDAYGNVATSYRGTVHFSSSDGRAMLPADYTFTAADNGIHTFQVTLKTAGRQTITARDTGTSSLTGNTTLTVAPATLTITPAAGQAKLYGAAVPVLTYVATGFIPGDTASLLTGLLGTTATRTSSVGNYPFTLGTLSAGANYTLVLAAGAPAFAVTPAPLTITADNKMKVYGQANPALTATYTGFVNGDTPAVVSGLMLSTTATAGSGVGAYVIMATGAMAANYKISLVNGTLTVTRAPLTITADNQTRVAGTTVTLTATYTGLVNGDTSSVVNGLTLSTYQGDTVGTYPITASGATAANYTITHVDGILTVVPADPDHFVVTTTAADPDLAGTAFDVAVTVQDAYGNTVTDYTGTVTFSSADPNPATLPADYTFTTDDAGVYTFTAAATLFTAGDQDVTVTDTTSGITGTAIVTVDPAAADHFQLDAPAHVSSGVPFDVTVTALDPYGNVASGYTGTIHVTSTDPDQGVLLPADYPFTAEDGGVHTFVAGVTLLTEGDQFITVMDLDSGIVGNATVTVDPTGGSPSPRGGSKGHADGIRHETWTLLPARAVRSQAAIRVDFPAAREGAQPTGRESVDNLFAVLPGEAWTGAPLQLEPARPLVHSPHTQIVELILSELSVHRFAVSLREDLAG